MDETNEAGSVSETPIEPKLPSKTKPTVLSSTQNESSASPPTHGQQQQQPSNPRTKRKHRRANKPYRKNNWKFQMPYLNYMNSANNGGAGIGIASARGGRNCGNIVPKIQRSQPLVPYNTNKFLMEEHLAEITSGHWTPAGRTRDSSFSMDSEDNYFYSMPEDEEEFLTKEFSNVYEKARAERLENLTKSELIAECLQIEDRYSKDLSYMRQQQSSAQRNAMEYLAKIRALEDIVKAISKENHNLRSQLVPTASMVNAGCTSAVASTGASNATDPMPMDSSTEDSESDSSTSSSVSSSSSSPTSASSSSSSSNKTNDEKNDVSMESKDRLLSPKSSIQSSNESNELNNHSNDQFTDVNVDEAQNCEDDNSDNIMEIRGSSEDVASNLDCSSNQLHSMDAQCNSSSPNELPVMK